MLHLQYGSLEPLVREWGDAFAPLAYQQNLRYNTHYDLPEITYAYDADVLEKILNNLLSNAFKYTPKGGNICLRIWLNSTEEMLQIEVEDSGPGISPEKLDLIFQRFYRANRGSTTKGSGIGLAFTQELVELYGGTITAQSKQGEGSTFSVSLPMRPHQIHSTKREIP